MFPSSRPYMSASFAAGGLRDRSAIVDDLVAVLQDSGARWAWRGVQGARPTWIRSTGPAALELWWRPTAMQRAFLIRELTTELGGAVVSAASRGSGQEHLAVAFETLTGLALVDLAEGDLRVGPVLITPADDVLVEEGRLFGVAGAADLLLRWLLHGRRPGDRGLEQARAAWAQASTADRGAATELWREQLGTVAADVVAVLEGGACDVGVSRRARAALARGRLRSGGLAQAWRRRDGLAPVGRHVGPLGLPMRGIVVVLVHAEGSDRSPVVSEAAQRLTRAGFDVHRARCGPARNDRSRTGGPPRPAGKHAAAPQGTAATAVGHPAPRGLGECLLLIADVWHYARDVAPARWGGAVVICEGYEQALGGWRWPWSCPARWLHRALPAPDLLVLLEAIAELSEPRGTAPKQDEMVEQAALRSLLDHAQARVAQLVMDTSGVERDPVAELIRQIVEAVHHRRGSRG